MYFPFQKVINQWQERHHYVHESFVLKLHIQRPKEHMCYLRFLLKSILKYYLVGFFRFPSLLVDRFLEKGSMTYRKYGFRRFVFWLQLLHRCSMGKR